MKLLPVILCLLLQPARPTPVSSPASLVAKWPEFAAPDGSFRLRMPRTPVQGADGFVVTEGADTRYWVNEVPVPEKLRALPPDEVLGAFVPVGSSPYGPDFVPSLKESLPFKVQGRPAMYVHVEGRVKARPEYATEICVVHRGPTLLAVGYAARTDLFRPGLFKQMLATLRFGTAR